MNINQIITYLLYIIQLVEKIFLKFLNQYGDGDYSSWDDIMNPTTTEPVAETTV